MEKEMTVSPKLVPVTHGTRGSRLIGPTDSLTFGVLAPSKYIPACSSLAQSYRLIYNRDTV